MGKYQISPPPTVAIEKPKTGADSTFVLHKGKKPPEEERAEAAERERAGHLEVGVGTVRRKTNLRLAVLENLARTRRYDRETPELINRLRPSESLERQESNVDALTDVSVAMLTTVMYYGYDSGLNIDNFTAVSELGTAIAKINPQAAENAALHKLREFVQYAAAHPTETESSAMYVKNEWGNIVQLARQMSQKVGVAASLDLNKKLKEEDKWTFKGFLHRSFKEHPYVTGGLALLGAVGGFFAIRGICRRLFGTQEQPAAQEKIEKPKGAWGWVKWVLGGSLAVFLVGKIFGFDKTVEWLKKQAVDAKDAWGRLFGESPEFKKYREMYTRMAGRISKEMGIAIEGEFLAELAKEKYKDFVDDDGWFKKNLLDPALDAVTDNKYAKYVPYLWTKSQRRQANAIRSYIKSNSQKQLIEANIRIGNETTVGQALVTLDDALIKKGGGTGKPSEGAEQGLEVLNAETVERQILPFLNENYGAIQAAIYRKIILMPYREMMAWKSGKRKSLVQKIALEAKRVGGEIGITEIPPEEAEALIAGEALIRRFLRDHEETIKTLSLPAAATVGAVLAELLNAKTELKKKELPSGAEELTNEDIEDIAARDQAAKNLPKEKYAVYLKQRKIAVEKLQANRYVKSRDIATLIAAAEKVEDTLRGEAASTVDKVEREKKQKQAVFINARVKKLKDVTGDRREQWKAYDAEIASNASEYILHENFMRVVRENENVMEAYSLLEIALSEEHRWTSILQLAGLQITRMAYVWLRAPSQYRSFARYYYGIFHLPTSLVGHLNTVLRRPRSGIALTARRIAEGESRLSGELGGGDVIGGGSLEQRANLGTPVQGLQEETEKQARNRYEDERKLFDHDKQMLTEETAVEALEQKKKTLQKRAAPDKDELRLIDEQLKVRRGTLKQMREARIKLGKDAIAEASDDLYSRLRGVADDPERALTRQQWKELEDLARRGAEHNKDLMRVGEDILEEIQEAGKRGASPEEIQSLTQKFNDTVGNISSTQRSSIQKLADFVERRMGRAGKVIGKAIKAPGALVDVGRKAAEIRTSAKGKELTSADQKQFRKVFSIIINWQKRGAKPKTDKPLLRVLKNKFYFYGLALATAAGVGLAARDKQVTRGKVIGQAAIDVAPLTGTFSDFYALVKGKEFVTGRKVVGWERATRAAFGVVGLASDILLVAGIGAGMRAGLGTLRTSVQMSKIARLKGAVKVAEEAAERVAKTGAKKAVAEAAVGETTEAAARVAAREVAEAAGKMPGRLDKLLDALRAIERKRTVATIALAGVGIAVPLTMSLVKTDEMEVPPAMRTVLGGQDSQIDEIDLEQLPAEPEEETADTE